MTKGFAYSACIWEPMTMNPRRSTGCTASWMNRDMRWTSPAGACTMVCFVLFAGAMPDGGQGAIRWLCFVLTVITGFLMVSRVRYFSFKEYDIFRAHPYRVLVSFLVLLALLYSSPKLMGFAYCAAYIASGLVYTFYLLPKSSQQSA